MWMDPGRDRDRRIRQLEHRSRQHDRPRSSRPAPAPGTGPGPAFLLARLAFLTVIAAARLLIRAAPFIAAAAVTAALWPAVLVTAGAVAAAWAAGLHPARLLRAAARSLLMTAAYAAAAAAADRPWAPGRLYRWAAQPWTDYRAASLGIIHGHAAAALLAAPLAVPAGLAAGAAVWAWRTRRMTHGLAGRTALSPATWDDRQWRRQAATARRDAREPGRVPLATRRGVPAGTVIRTVAAPWTRVLTIPAADFTRHMVVVGASGSGKTTLMIRLWSGWFAAALRRPGPRPLLIAIDGKGGPDSRVRAAETAAAMTAAGARNVAIWPDRADLSLWDLEPRALAVTLHQLIESGDGAASYYADMSAAVVSLAVRAPAGPPRSAAEFLARLTVPWLTRAYAATGNPADLGHIAAAKDHIGDIAMRYRLLLDRLGPGLDGTGALTDPATDAWYLILEGTAEPSVAEAQAMALTELAARAAASPVHPPRRILLAADDYSAVSRRVPLSNLYERGRSLGLGVMVSAQSWEGLGDSDDERQRIASTADGGIFVLRAPDPEPLATLAGTRRILETGRRLLAPGITADEGTSSIQHAWTADPDRIRRLNTGQACYITHGTATYIHVAPAPAPRTRPAPPAGTRPAPDQPGPPARPGPVPPPSPGPRPQDVLGPDPRRDSGPDTARPEEGTPPS